MFTRIKILAALGVGLMVAASAPAEARTYVRHTTIVHNHYGYGGYHSGFGHAFMGAMAGAAIGNALTGPHMMFYPGYGYHPYGWHPVVVAPPQVIYQQPPVIVQQPPVVVQQPPQYVAPQQ